MMKKSGFYKRLMVLVVFLFLGLPGHSQNIIQGNDAKESLEATARAEAEEWTIRLAMSAKQTALMQDKLVEYAIKERQVLYSKLREEVKAEMLTELELAENKSMRDILTKQQYDRFLYIKRQLAQQNASREKTRDTSDLPSQEN